ncbi:MAG: tetraacyldisaccharide 4'-kinase [Alphaproteobacteria bacterium]
MRAPEFWTRSGGPGLFLAPLGCAFAAVSGLRRRLATPWRAPVPVICVGNLVAGGAGKTPVALGLGLLLRERGRDIHFLSRGHGGRLAGPVRVDPARHTAREVGDEPLLLAELAPCWVARDRVAGAKAAIAAGADVIVMDDGFQNNALAKSLSLLVIDGGYGFGNGRVMPAGPLREPVAGGLARADAAIVMTPDTRDVMASLANAGVPVLQARLAVLPSAERLTGRKVVGFAGIGRPEKFFATLEELGCTLVARYGFADHHDYTPEEIMRIAETADAAGAVPVTTAKDYARLSPDARAMVETVGVTLEWRDQAEIDALLKRAVRS